MYVHNHVRGKLDPYIDKLVAALHAHGCHDWDSIAGPMAYALTRISVGVFNKICEDPIEGNKSRFFDQAMLKGLLRAVYHEIDRRIKETPGQLDIPELEEFDRRSASG